MPVINQDYDIFDLPPPVMLIVPSDNRGTWSGLEDYRLRFPDAFFQYRQYCRLLGQASVGTSFLSYDRGYWIASLIVAHRLSNKIEMPSVILENMEKSIVHLLDSLGIYNDFPQPIKMVSQRFGAKWHLSWQEIEDMITPIIWPYHLDWMTCY